MAVERVRVGEVLELQRRAVTVEPGREYVEIGVRSFGRGIFHKEPVDGASLGDKRVFAVEPDDLVISNVFAWEGAIAVASPAEAGLIGSHRFMTFIPRDVRIDASWAAWFFRSEVGLALLRRASPGSAGRNRTLAIDRFESLMIPLPPLAEQRRVAALLDTTRRISDSATRLADRMSTLLTALTASIASRPDLDDATKIRASWRKVPLGTVLTRAADSVRVDPHEAYPNFGIRSFGRGCFSKPRIDGGVTAATTLYRVRAGQFIYSRLFAFEGAYTYVPTKFDGYFVSNEFPAFHADPEHLDARWLAATLRTPQRWAELASTSKGLGVRRQRVPIESLLSYELWLPPLDQQLMMLARVDAAKQAAAAREWSGRRISALVPAGLDRAFAGLG